LAWTSQVTDQQPRAILEGLYAKAAEGDTAAARLVYELARIQREDEAR